MSLTVRINKFQLPKAKSNLLGRVEFRGVAHTTTELNCSSEFVDVNQSFIWPLARPADEDEAVIVELRQQTTKILLKTGIGGSATSRGGSRGTITSSTKIIGRFVLLMQGLLQENRLHIQDRLVDLSNKPIDAFVSFDVSYQSPDDEAGNFDSSHVVKSLHQKSSSIDDDQQMLLDIEQNIANLEKSLKKGASSSGGRSSGGGDGRAMRKVSDTGEEAAAPASSSKPNILKRVMSSGSTSLHEKSQNPAAKYDRATSDNESSSKPVRSIADKKVTLRTVRNFMKLGRSRHPSRESRGDSSTEDEGRSLITDSEDALGGPASSGQQSHRTHTNEPSTAVTSPSTVGGTGQPGYENLSQAGSTHSNASSDGEETTNNEKLKKIKNLAKCNDHLKSQDFQVCVTIIEARQLPGLNMDPVVCIQVGDQKKYTSVKESTNCPYYNEYFVFDFHMPPVMLFDKIITLSVLQNRGVFQTNKLVGSFKLDVATLWHQRDHQFYHKWALLTDPEDLVSGPKGYLKCDVGIIGKGDTVKVPPKSEKDPDDIEANLLLPDGVPIERQRAKFIVKIYRADGLPRMNSSLMANVKRAFTGETKDLVNPYVQVSFAGLSGKSSVKKASYNPVWNEQLVFTEMFPPLCQRIKIQLRDADPMKPSIIGTHYIDLKQISNDGEKGFLPTYGPSFVHLYGSTRDYNLIDQNSNLNTGLGEGVSYRARLLIAIRTEITDNVELLTDKNVELESTLPISESSYCKHDDFFMFGSVLEASMIDRKVCDRPVYFELSMGNAGNSLDGHNESAANLSDDDELETVDTTSYSSTTSASKPISHDKNHFFLPYWDNKPCMDVRCSFPDLRRRMYNSNMIGKITERMEIGLAETNLLIEDEDPTAEVKLRSVLEEVATSCNKYVSITKGALVGPGTGKTKLDKERMKLCLREVESIGNMSRNLRALVTKSSMKERYKTAHSYLGKLRFLVDDPQHALPDVFIWMIANGKRVAYHRISARDLIYSTVEEETGVCCGKVQTIFLKLPGKLSEGPAGWQVRAKLHIYLWLGVLKHKKYFFSGLPRGFELSYELQNSEKSNLSAPSEVRYVEKHAFQMRAHVYQARSLIGSDASGLSDPYATVYVTEFSRTTQVIEETLSPTWDELLLFDEIVIYGAKDEIKKDPPTIVVDIYDQDKVGKSEFIGRALAKPRIKLKDNHYQNPVLEWFEITRGLDGAGELLAAFEMLELGSDDIPRLTDPKYIATEFRGDKTGPSTMTILPVPREVRPNLARFRIEVLFWGLRDVKRVHFMTVDKPRIDIECSGRILNSSIIQNAKKNPNFANMLKFMDLELPLEERYAPPITIRAVDCRSFGRYTLVGTHQITSIHKYMHRPPPKEETRRANQCGQIVLSRQTDLLPNSTTLPGDSALMHSISGENLTLYGAACVSKFAKGKKSKKKLEHEDTYDTDDDDESSKDWWTKYFLSYEKLIESSKPATNFRGLENHIGSGAESGGKKLGVKTSKLVSKLSPKTTPKKIVNPNTASCQIYPCELETLPEYNNFKEWLLSFPLYRGKKTGDSTEDENRIVGFFKGAIKVYKLPIEKGMEPAFAPTLPLNDPIHVLVRVYVVKATDLHPMDLNGKADPYVVLQLGSKRVSDKENYVSKQLNPVFGKCFEIEATFPQDSMLTVQIYDWDLVGSDDLIGETRIDLENRFYSKHRALCGIAARYEDTGYNQWRDPMKPTQILTKLCKENKLEPPQYLQDRVTIGRYCFTFSHEEIQAWNSPTTCKFRDEHLALAVLHRWEEVPRVGCKIVPEHIESRSLYSSDKPGIEQGKLEMWVDMFPMDMPLPGPPVDISPRKPKSYELRIVIWNTDDVVLEDDAFFTGEKMSDIYVKGWLTGPQDIQATDIHYRSLTGEGNFNWRFIFPFDYLAAEERIVLSRKESLFSWDETEVKIPARLELQVWDADHFSADDFLGAISLNLNRFPRGAKSSKLCTLDMLKTENVPMVNIFKQKRVRGWWPFFIKKENDEMELTGKVEAEIHLLTKEEAEKNPAGYGRNEPDPLEKPNRPDASFMWFLNPLKSIRYIVWHNYKWRIIKGLIIIGLAILLLLFFYAIPGYSVKKMLGA
ncbi:otoferlin-like isoform X2 [Wyeomyia smithii]|uniref:otoferlin-like isoform X2 n=1 Tax=Wyeomyia smithii TaxID=174621 RepID=UPI002467D187|nr:otoferlin-like isoform X2 [Wyeomyia smithii]XP_055522428.1 otoferlin-like isoform X2 [Wyeomyia smithii]XP_055522483.1 otoferlin-like isoform X2 [Wyeomyia smithii]XP_055522524.1 otoferlin-like isoform X2 [Wyeomyia smithii]XP_055522583.1 otoferlin-like isoform X2 [Wyeomyia smithii]XP_055522625.1 otoferlin-like isoform X2 [Wyeomyia smithii]XP_055522679.1 otoferlin-like isoform X2 [Wyeomyia smithii]XP_055522722.1 otoferlin-like isoform X2 [Wyeomyia smithii]XP_055551712.1 otoferlin-like isofo